MIKNNLFYFLLFSATIFLAQETVVNGEFAIRDFTITKDSLFFIEKRYSKYHHLPKNDTTTNKYFIGGYGLKIFKDNNTIISISNEFEATVSSLRFYNKSLKDFDAVYYYKKAKSVNALLLKKHEKAIMSLTDNKILIVDYSKRPAFKIYAQIELNSLSRALFYKNGFLFFATDGGDVFKYDINLQKKERVLSVEESVTSIHVNKDVIYYTTINGKIIKYNILSEKFSEILLESNFILNTILSKNNLVCGSFNGKIYVIDINSFTLIDTLNHHKKSVLKIEKGTDNIFYSSSIDKTIKKWKLL